MPVGFGALNSRRRLLSAVTHRFLFLCLLERDGSSLTWQKFADKAVIPWVYLYQSKRCWGSLEVLRKRLHFGSGSGAIVRTSLQYRSVQPSSAQPNDRFKVLVSCIFLLFRRDTDAIFDSSKQY